MSQIPIASDVAEVIGTYAASVENRSLLLDKFVFHKSWPVELDERGKEIKWDDASRWSFLRIANGASSLLQKEADKKSRGAEGRNVAQTKRERLSNEAEIAQSLSSVKWDTQEISDLRARHTRRFLNLFRKSFPERNLILIGKLEGRLAINLSDSLIPNAGISLDRLFGLPYIPGSAVKGACRHAALQQMKSAPDSEKIQLHRRFQTIFGSTENDYSSEGDLFEYARDVQKEQQVKKGCIDFLSAYPVNNAEITVDLTTVHYPDYYRSGRIEDLKNESPKPNPFPVVKEGGQFAFCLSANQLAEDPQEAQVALATAEEWLKAALSTNGIGAKTASGYGWFSFPKGVLEELDAMEKQELEEKRKRQEAHDDLLRREAAAKRAQEEELQRAERNKAEKKRQANMSPDELADEEVCKWDDNLFRNRLNSFDKTKGGLTDALKKAMVRSIHNDDNRKQLWLKFKEKATRGNAANIVNLVRVKSKEMGLGKMP